MFGTFDRTASDWDLRWQRSILCDGFFMIFQFNNLNSPVNQPMGDGLSPGSKELDCKESTFLPVRLYFWRKSHDSKWQRLPLDCPLLPLTAARFYVWKHSPKPFSRDQRIICAGWIGLKLPVIPLHCDVSGLQHWTIWQRRGNVTPRSIIHIIRATD